MHRTTRTIVCLTVLLSSLTAVDAVAQQARTRDSAGVRIIENSARKDAPIRFRVGPRPLLQVGGIELNPEQEFDHKQGYLRGVELSNGGLAVVDVFRVHYFDAKGKRVKIVGRRGQGPEELLYVTAMCRTRGDTLILNDSHNRRLSVIDGNGRVVTTILQGDHGSAPFSFCFDDGSFVLQRAIGDLGSRQNRITRLRADGSVVSVLGTFASPMFDFVTMVGPAMAVSGNALYYGDPFTSEIRNYDPSGKLRRIIRTGDRGDAITAEEAERRMSMTIPSNVPADERKQRMERMRSRPYARNWPAFFRLEIGAGGTIWVQDYLKSRGPADAWTAIDSTGQIVGRLEFPAVPPRSMGREVLGFGRDNVIVRTFDADGATSIVVYPLVKVDGRSR